jgi:phosphopantothenoylcysteine decarboxylase/phosphopantothenate--cysteine ligase
MKIVLAISGSIAAYKAPELIRQLQKKGCEIRVARTKSAAHFTTDLVLETLSGFPVMSSSLDLPSFSENSLIGDSSGPIDHIALARWADVMLYAPASAAALSRLANGLATDAPTVLATAFEKKLFIAPAMNQGMWKHPSVVRNLKTLRSYGYKIIEPDSGELACGEVGPGRLASLERILDEVLAVKPSLKVPFDVLGKKVLISTGPTRAYIDPIRYISNPATGRIGLELAKVFDSLGAQVTLVHGSLPLNIQEWAQKEGLDISFQSVSVETPQEMLEAVSRAFPSCDLFMSAAAVNDFVPEFFSDSKIKKDRKEKFEISLKKSTDILAQISQSKKPGQLVIGFAAETEKLLENAKRKLRQKNLDAVIGNEIKKSKGFGDQETEFHFITQNSKTERIGPGRKAELAPKLCHFILKLWAQKAEARSGINKNLACKQGAQDKEDSDGSLEEDL